MENASVESSVDIAGNENLNRSESLLPQDDSQNQPHDLQNETDETIFSTDISTDFSNFTEKENSLMEDGVKDRFNGIFYNVHHKDNRVSVLFATRELFTRFVSSLRKEFAEHKSTYITHVQGHKCFINIHKNENGLAVTGPGCRIWRETTFLRLATSLYRQYETDTNKHIEETRRQTASAASQSSTPNSSRNRLDSETPWSPVLAEKVSARKLESISEMQSDIKSQVSSLMELIISLQEQVNLLTAKLENNGVTSDQENYSNQNENSASNDQSVIIESVSENTTPRERPVNEEQSIVPGRNSYSGAVQKTMERQNKTKTQSEQNHQRSNEQAAVLKTTDRNKVHANSQNMQGRSSQQNQSQSSSNASAKTLLIGDSQLSSVNKKRTEDQCALSAIPWCHR